MGNRLQLFREILLVGKKKIVGGGGKQTSDCLEAHREKFPHVTQLPHQFASESSGFGSQVPTATEADVIPREGASW